MANPDERAVLQVLLDLHGKTYAEEIGIAVEKNTPAVLFQTLCAALLFSARIRAGVAVAAARALIEQGWTTPEKMAGSSWEERVRTLNQSGYARYDERTASMLGETAELALEKYAGDLRNLRQQAERDPGRERKLLKEFKGIGDVGVSIFFREVQAAWEELFPYLDERSAETAKGLGLPGEAEGLLKLAGAEDYPRLVAALIRMRLEGDEERVRQRAAERK
jgi:hypothetical protein